MAIKFNDEETRSKRSSVTRLIEFYNIPMILNNDLIKVLPFEVYRNVEPDDDEEDDEEDLYLYESTPEVFQYYIIKEQDLFIASLLNEPVFYNSEIDLYLLGITHWGTSWDYVLTDIDLIYDKNRELNFNFETIQKYWSR